MLQYRWALKTSHCVKQARRKRLNTVRFQLFEACRVVTFIETESRVVVSRAGGRENGKILFNGYRVSLWKDEKKFWRQIVVMVSQQCECMCCM